MPMQGPRGAPSTACLCLPPPTRTRPAGEQDTSATYEYNVVPCFNPSKPVLALCGTIWKMPDPAGRGMVGGGARGVAHCAVLGQRGRWGGAAGAACRDGVPSS
jgi:hypothetical protein